MPLYKNRSRTKKFPIEILLKMIDSDSPRVFMLESIISKSVSIGNFFVLDLFLYSGNRGNPHFKLFAELEFFDVVENFDRHIRLPLGFSH